MNPRVFGIIGGGWRAEYYLRVAQELPEHFCVGGMFVRNEGKGRVLEERWGARTCRSLDALLRVPGLQFVVISVPANVAPDMIRRLAEHGMPALSETPPAADLNGLLGLQDLIETEARVQVAEQYQFQPLHAARLQIARSGRLGTITQAQVSAAHGYHGLSLLRGFLGVTFERATIRARDFVSPIIAGPDRGGSPTEEKVTQSRQVIADLDFGDRLGVFDFTGDQYFSWIRRQRVLVRGERGEITNREVRYLKDFSTPVELELRRVDAGQD
ncbi:MAG: Gfo/Idh/MocA family oxidoreductase, partial [Anaerolineae bacterium]|nr:Gfo/Idh/MocA family oxidoreductase [Anaerolineae bacterium]